MRCLINFIIHKRMTLLLSMSTLFFIAAYAQTPDNGTIPAPTRQDVNNFLQNNNINPSQVNTAAVKSFLQDKNNPDNNPGADNNQQIKQSKDSLIPNTEAKQTGPGDTYGADVFSQAAITNVSELSTPPLDYPIGVGDHIVVALWGGGELQQDYVVARDGSIFPAGLGKIVVQGLTFDEARSLIYSRFKSIVPASTNIAVTLGQPRTINVNVGGEVRKPGPLTVSAFSNAFNVIGLAGGVTDRGNLRSIQVKRDGKVIEELDVYKYLSTGDIGEHVYLQNNDFILVTFVEKKVQATGLFKRPMYYQLKKDEGIKALMKYAGGFFSNAYTSTLKVYRNENEKQQIHNVNATDIIKGSGEDYLLNDGDIVQADSIKQGIVNKVMLKGAVTYPGVYEYREGDHLFDVINRAGGLLKNTYLHRIYVFRGGADSTTVKSERIELDLSNINSVNNGNDKNNILLQKNDLIQLFTTNEFVDPQYVDIYGEVRKEGHLLKYGGMTLEDLLYLSGGIKPDAQYGRLEISSIVDVDSAERGLKPTRTIVRSYAILPNLEVDTIASKVILQNYDQVFVRANPDFRIEQNVQLQGLFKYPGVYPKLYPTEKLSDYVERAGGFKDNADLTGAILFRQNVDLFRASIIDKNRVNKPAVADSIVMNLHDPVSIDLEKALKDKDDKENIVLQQNDIIYVPEIDPFITVRGAVQSPLKLSFDEKKIHLGYYIDQAGGFGVRPWRKRIYVTYANGKSSRTRNFAFFHFYPKIKQGSTITVPERPENGQFSDDVRQSLSALIPVLIGGIILKII
jgi:protein involved in polysaccharide export with SLBB domain